MSKGAGQERSSTWRAVSTWLGERGAGRAHVRRRNWLVGALVVVAVLVVLVGSVTLWAHDFLFNTDTWVATVAPIAKDPAVTHDLSVYLAQQGTDTIDIGQRTQNALPPRLQPLADPIAIALQGWLQTFLQRTIERFVTSPTAYDVWVTVNRVAHRQVVNVLQNKPGALRANGGKLELNLLPLLSKALIAVQQRAPRLLPRPIPEISAATPPGQAEQQLSQALGVTLPAGFAQITLLQSQDLSTAQKIVRIFNAVVVVLIVAAVALIVAAVWLSLRRRRTLIELGLGVGLALIVTRVLVRRIEDDVAAGLAGHQGGAVATAALRAIIGNLQSFTLWFLVAGIVVAVVAFLLGKPQWFHKVAHGAAGLGASAAGLGASGAEAIARQGTVGRVLLRHTDWLRVGGVVVAAIILLATTPGWAWIVAIALLLLAWELFLWYLVYRWTPPGPAAS